MYLVSGEIKPIPIHRRPNKRYWRIGQLKFKVLWRRTFYCRVVLNGAGIIWGKLDPKFSKTQVQGTGLTLRERNFVLAVIPVVEGPTNKLASSATWIKEA